MGVSHCIAMREEEEVFVTLEQGFDTRFFECFRNFDEK